MKRLLRVLLSLCLLLSLMPLSTARAESGATVYVRKHVSILYDNSGSMKYHTAGEENLKWCYASYAAQAFTGLLNDTDSLSITFMEGDPLSNLDLKGLRQDAVTAVFDRTSTATADTPIERIGSALSVLEHDGLKPGLGANDSGEQFWLVLTTDGVFRENSMNLSPDRVASELETIMERYPDLHVVYFGIGTQNDSSDSKAVDFRPGSGIDADLLSRLHSHPNFTAVYAENQEQIVDTMQALSNQISGRYSVSNECRVSGNEVQIFLSGEGSPIRNIAVMAQETNAKLLSAEAENGSQLVIDREAVLRYPHNDGYDNVPAGTLGGTVALITGPNGEKVPTGNITLTFSEPINAEKLSLMYEPAIHISIQMERKTGSDKWEPVPDGSRFVEGDELRISYAICEDETGKVLDTAKLFGKTEARIMFNGEPLAADETVTLEAGDSSFDVYVSMMDGGYQISTSRKIHADQPGAGDLTVSSSGPIEMMRSEAAANTDKSVEFSLFFRGQPVDASLAADVSIQVTGDSKTLNGQIEQPKTHVFRFTPRDDNCLAGAYTVQLICDGEVIASEEIRILPNETYYTAEAGPSISIMSNHVADNKETVSFTVTAHRDDGDALVTAAEADLFQVSASSNGTTASGFTSWQEGGKICFALQDANAEPGVYTVTLSKDDAILAQTQISVIHYDATYTIETIVSEPDTVDRFNLERNTASVSFVVYEDGVPCTAAQLEAMMDRQLFVTTDLSSPFVKMEISIGTADGKPAIICTPVSSTTSGFVRYFHHVMTSVGIGGLARDDFAITLKVDMLHGAEDSGSLDLIGYNLVPLIIFLVFLAICVLIAMFIIANMRADRIKPGILWSFEITTPANTAIPRYRVESLTEKRVGMGIRFMLLPRSEKHSFRGVKFSAQNTTKWLAHTSPEATVSGTPADLACYTHHLTLTGRTELLDQIKNGLAVLNGNQFAMLTRSPTRLLPSGERHTNSENLKKTCSMMSGAILMRKDGMNPPRYQFWCYSASTRRNANRAHHRGRHRNAHRR